MTPGERRAAASLSIVGLANLRPEASPIGLLLYKRHIRMRQIPPEQRPHRLRLVDNQLFFDRVIAQRRNTAHPHALLLRGGDLVADAFGGAYSGWS